MGVGRQVGRYLHVVEEGDLALLVGDDGEGDLAAGHLVDVLDPALMATEGVGRQTNQLSTALGELGLELGEGAELGGADRGVVLRVGEEDNPLVADPLVEVDGASSGVGLEVGGHGTEAEAVKIVSVAVSSSCLLFMLAIGGGGGGGGGGGRSGNAGKKWQMNDCCTYGSGRGAAIVRVVDCYRNIEEDVVMESTGRLSGKEGGEGYHKS